MLDDTMESVMDDPEDMEEEAQSEIDKVYIIYNTITRQVYIILFSVQFNILRS